MRRLRPAHDPIGMDGGNLPGLRLEPVEVAASPHATHIRYLLS